MCSISSFFFLKITFMYLNMLRFMFTYNIIESKFHASLVFPHLNFPPWSTWCKFTLWSLSKFSSDGGIWWQKINFTFWLCLLHYHSISFTISVFRTKACKRGYVHTAGLFSQELLSCSTLQAELYSWWYPRLLEKLFLQKSNFSAKLFFPSSSDDHMLLPIEKNCNLKIKEVHSVSVLLYIKKYSNNHLIPML